MGATNVSVSGESPNGYLPLQQALVISKWVSTNGVGSFQIHVFVLGPTVSEFSHKPFKSRLSFP